MLNRQVREGRNLLAEQQGSLAAEMGAMTDEQVGKNYKAFQSNYTDNMYSLLMPTHSSLKLCLILVE